MTTVTLLAADLTTVVGTVSIGDELPQAIVHDRRVYLQRGTKLGARKLSHTYVEAFSIHLQPRDLHHD